MDRAEQKSSQKINVPCLDEVKQTRGTLSNPVKYLHYIAQNKKAFEIGSPHRRRRQELCRARGKSRVPPARRSPCGCLALPRVAGTSWQHPPASPQREPSQPRGAARGWYAAFQTAHAEFKSACKETSG